MAEGARRNRLEAIKFAGTLCALAILGLAAAYGVCALVPCHPWTGPGSLSPSVVGNHIGEWSTPDNAVEDWANANAAKCTKKRIW